MFAVGVLDICIVQRYLEPRDEPGEGTDWEFGQILPLSSWHYL